MPGFDDVEKLLDAAADKGSANASRENRRPSDSERGAKDDRRERDLVGLGKDYEKERRRRDGSVERGHQGEDLMSPRSDRGSAHGSHRSRRRSRSREAERFRSRRDRYSEQDRAGGDYYRGGGRARSRSRSPDDDRHYRPLGPRRRERDDPHDLDRYRQRERDRDRVDRRDRGGRPPRRSRSPRRPAEPEPKLTDDERDRRTVFVQQLAARLRTKDLIRFFEKVGPVKDAQIVKDRVSQRSKGVGYVEFRQEESVSQAIQLTGQKLLGIPIIAQLTEAEKNRQARTGENSSNHANSAPFHRLYVGNIHFSITEEDLHNVFDPFGELEFVQLQKEEAGRSRGYGFVQFRDPAQAKDALEKMNGFELAGRPIRVGLGNDKFTPESTQNVLQRAQGPNQGNFQGSAFSGSGGRGAPAGGSGNNYERSGGRDNEKAAAGASALDDTDVAGVNFNNYSRDALMRKLARTDEPSGDSSSTQRPAVKPKTETKQLPVQASQASRCVVLRNMFDPAQEDGESWVKELEDDVKAECEDKYGHVMHIAVDPNTQGDIYVKFDRVAGGENAIKGLNGRFFGGRQISAQPVVDAVYKSLFSQAL